MCQLLLQYKEAESQSVHFTLLALSSLVSAIGGHIHVYVKMVNIALVSCWHRHFADPVITEGIFNFANV